MKPERQKFLAEMKAYGEAKNIPNVSENVGRFLHSLVQMIGAKKILEVGTANGYSTIWLADAICEQENARLLGLEISTPSYNKALENISAQNLDEIVELRFGNALDLLPQISEQFDLIFIDAQKALYAEYWKLIQPLMSENCTVVFDDVIKFPEKTRALYSTLAEENAYEKIVLPTDGDDGAMIVRKK